MYKNLLTSLFMVSTALTLTGCAGTGRTMVLSVPSERHIANSYTLVPGRSTVPFNPEFQAQFEADVHAGLAAINMTQGKDLIIDYRFLQFDEGNRVVRYLAGGFGNAGEGDMTIEVTFRDKNKKELNKIHVGGKITAGFFGGSFNHAVEQAAQQVIKYVTINFKE